MVKCVEFLKGLFVFVDSRYHITPQAPISGGKTWVKTLSGTLQTKIRANFLRKLTTSDDHLFSTKYVQEKSQPKAAFRVVESLNEGSYKAEQ